MSKDTVTISRFRYDALLVAAIGGWALFLFIFGVLIGVSA